MEGWVWNNVPTSQTSSMTTGVFLNCCWLWIYIFTASRHHQIPSQHSHRVLCQRDGAVNLSGVISLKSYRTVDLHLSVTLTCIQFSSVLNEQSIISPSLFLSVPIKSLSLQLNQQHQSSVLQIAGVEGLRPPQDGFFILSHIFDVVSLSLTCVSNL